MLLLGIMRLKLRDSICLAPISKKLQVQYKSTGGLNPETLSVSFFVGIFRKIEQEIETLVLLTFLRFFLESKEEKEEGRKSEKESFLNTH